MRAYENHFGMVTSTIIAISLSLVMATAAIFVDHLDFGIPQRSGNNPKFRPSGRKKKNLITGTRSICR